MATCRGQGTVLCIWLIHELGNDDILWCITCDVTQLYIILLTYMHRLFPEQTVLKKTEHHTCCSHPLSEAMVAQDTYLEAYKEGACLMWENGKTASAHALSCSQGTIRGMFNYRCCTPYMIPLFGLSTYLFRRIVHTNCSHHPLLITTFFQQNVFLFHACF
jgi:hypothetical protein